MNANSPAMPRLGSDAAQGESLRSSWLTTFVFLALAFGSIATALTEASGTPGAAAPARLAATPASSYAPSASAAPMRESPEVDAVVRNWVWETQAAGPVAPSRAGDIEELWLQQY